MYTFFSFSFSILIGRYPLRVSQTRIHQPRDDRKQESRTRKRRRDELAVGLLQLFRVQQNYSATDFRSDRRLYPHLFDHDVYFLHSYTKNKTIRCLVIGQNVHIHTQDAIRAQEKG